MFLITVYTDQGIVQIVVKSKFLASNAGRIVKIRFGREFAYSVTESK